MDRGEARSISLAEDKLTGLVKFVKASNGYETIRHYWRVDRLRRPRSCILDSNFKIRFNRRPPTNRLLLWEEYRRRIEILSRCFSFATISGLAGALEVPTGTIAHFFKHERDRSAGIIPSITVSGAKTYIDLVLAPEIVVLNMQRAKERDPQIRKDIFRKIEVLCNKYNSGRLVLRDTLLIARDSRGFLPHVREVGLMSAAKPASPNPPDAGGVISYGLLEMVPKTLVRPGRDIGSELIGRKAVDRIDPMGASTYGILMDDKPYVRTPMFPEKISGFVTL